ncbi:hypothetical protein A2774_01250 [Candidatus Roizmanbacteria bacterium RIFCSPHIGHO2_01_FULL_39_12c]|uniref:Cell shape-determining protein MreB n=1 Tax=Candidatus Roizmanbacteria bacterium RIFCSPHIGHO2_01_FULL_39_12c TaxID=1802031 RepID=A0A1F7GDU8_9BACT|nr:MAG: hypothetical protein A2774_01250 [Candidatus Roizmanbacteria bacterium RIFCSPHIGHO2_01_FULL_39_12c]OGK47500.1 MAG: hypothetical protein A2963_01255 [Candidatus Roizmanbacteria bacterium RIFCSPLOWO2_01_FULL_40_13]
MLNFRQLFNKIKLPFFSTFDVCFDLGTSNTRIGIGEKGIVLIEPSYLGYNTSSKEYIFFGGEAKSIVGKTPDFIKIIRPVINGVISDFDAQFAMLQYFMKKSVNIYLDRYKIVKPQLRAVAAVPNSVTEIEQKAVEEVLYKIGFSQVYLIEKPLASGIGIGLNIFYHHPHLLIDVGGGLIEMSIISGGGIVSKKTLKVAGDNMNLVLANYAYLKYGIVLGDNTCEHLKIYLLNFKQENKTFTVRGKSLETGLPKSVRIKTSDVKEALYGNIYQIVDNVKDLIDISPPEVLDEIYNRGIILTGGVAKAIGLDQFLASELKIDVNSVTDPDDTVIKGLLKLTQNFPDLLKLAMPKI